MGYKIDWVGTVALGIVSDEGRPLALSLEEGQQIPDEFKEGDEVIIENHPEHPAILASGMTNNGYYDITHVASGKVLRTWHRADMYKVKE